MLIPVWRHGQIISHAIVDDDRSDLLKFHWCPFGNGYAHASAGKRGAHVVLHQMCAGPGIGTDVSHINSNKMDNRRSNLRWCSRSANKHNRSDHLRADNSSGIRGVYWDKARDKWGVCLTVMGKPHYNGRHKNKEQAIAALNELCHRLNTSL